MRGGATPPPMHVHPHQEERITVVSGSVRSRSGAADRVLSPGDTVVSPPGEPHTVGPAGNEDVEMVVELRPALAYEQFIERSFALDRAGHVNAKGRGNPLRMATARPHEAEFFVPRVPIALQRALLRAFDWLGDSPARAVDEGSSATETTPSRSSRLSGEWPACCSRCSSPSFAVDWEYATTLARPEGGSSPD